MSHARRSQGGFTLLSQMIGLVISMIVLLGTLIVFKNLTRASVSSREDSSADSMRLSSVLSAQSLLQGAGFGLAAPAMGTDLVVITGATYSTSTQRLSGTAAAAGTAGNALVWGSNSSGAYQCEGLYAPSTGGLWRLAPQNCGSASAGWSTLTWTPVVMDDSERTVNQMTVTAPSGGCVPYGLTGKGSLLVTFTTVTTRLNHQVTDNTTSTAAQQTYNASSCLANFP